MIKVAPSNILPHKSTSIAPITPHTEPIFHGETTLISHHINELFHLKASDCLPLDCKAKANTGHGDSSLKIKSINQGKKLVMSSHPPVWQRDRQSQAERGHVPFANACHGVF